MAKRGKVIPFPGSQPVLPEPGVERELAEVHRCHHAEAIVVRSLFESEGIPTLLRSRLLASVHPFNVGDQGEVVGHGIQARNGLVDGQEQGLDQLHQRRAAETVMPCGFH